MVLFPMEIHVDTRIPFPLDLVYATYRDRLPETVSYLPNVRALQLLERRCEPDHIFCHYEWEGGGEIPAMIRSFISVDLLKWSEQNDWNNVLHQVRWRIAPHLFAEAIDCAGKNRFIAEGDGTRVETRGHLRINPAQLSNVPTMMRGIVANAAEKILGEAIAPNLEKMGDAIVFLLQEGKTTDIPQTLPRL
ncbi:hypothetical protein [Lyngbya confervoides]|uniref:Coenzyme Q-binding protein COQ10 START domain-containing protein n=1 Tax=Lyngbya confervoides BDU141951 TaxID=1574623 RepID=A0ABD4TC44_9CYAN|nr:hypothetical protein [Lyngbya confervoides]MCM1985370.1 hypothetical protein [Lyngbya confervoides BDU141951]